MKITVFFNSGNEKCNAVKDEVTDFLTKNGCSVDPVSDKRDLLRNIPDAVIVLGGDGSIMRASDVCAPEGVPILGINLGHTGYMAELEPGEIGLLKRMIDGEYRIEERMMLSVNVGGGSGYFVLNDAVISNGEISKMTSLELFCDGLPVSDYRADGLIISTPTGSTAYSMSAGGPIVDPTVECIIATPVCSHSLSSRPLIFSESSELSIKNIGREGVNVYLTLDGEINVKIDDGGMIFIKKADVRARFIRIKDYGFFGRFSKIIR